MGALRWPKTNRQHTLGANQKTNGQRRSRAVLTQTVGNFCYCLPDLFCLFSLCFASNSRNKSPPIPNYLGMDNLSQLSGPIQFKKANNREGNHKRGFGICNSEKPLSSTMQPTPHHQHNLMDNHQMQIFQPVAGNNNNQQIVGLKTKVKKPKLLSSKSLSRLVPRNLFFKRGSSINNVENNQRNNNNNNNNDNANEDNNNKLATTKSLPSIALRSHQHASLLDSNPLRCNNLETPVSLIALPRQSPGGDLFEKVECSTPFSKLSQPFSPIHGAAEQLNRVNLGEPYSFFSAATDSGFDSSAGQSVQSSSATFESQVEPSSSSAPTATNNATKGASECGGQEKRRMKSKSTFKNTTLVLRDVKNSIGLRIKARQESQAFAKLTNELASPPTKLYSPFNIYADSASKSKKEPVKSKRKLNLANNSKQVNKATSDQNSSMMSVDEVDDDYELTPKHRVVSQHRRHLLQANKFTFDSPAGRLRETVKDVEHFQQCIEDISKAIRSRDRSI